MRELQLPREVKEDQIRAKYDNGILTVEIPDSNGEGWLSLWGPSLASLAGTEFG